MAHPPRAKNAARRASGKILSSLTNRYPAAAGWGGDRVAWVTGPDGANAAVLDTRWDTDADAAEFAAALDAYVATLEAAGRSASILTPAPDRVVVISADDADTLAKIANVLGLAG